MLPVLFLDRLKLIMGEKRFASVEATFDAPRPPSVRVNTLKISLPEAQDYFASRNIQTEKVPWAQEGFVLQDIEPQWLSRLDAVCEGRLYIQSLSSMLPVVILDPQPGEAVLDLCAAPGSKTTQMAARMGNQGSIDAVEAIRPRFYRLKSVITLLGAQIVRAKCLDGRRYRSGSVLFDKILVDAPCSSESRFKTSEPKTVGYWSLRKIKEMVQKQRGLLLNACRMLKPGGVLLYSTCTFAPEENEGVLDWVLRKMPEEIGIEPIEIASVGRYPAVTSWNDRDFDPRLKDCFRVLPTEKMDGFFMAKLVRKS
jgi:NOL1/NOP2/sun family putative RNA methylase